MKSPDHHSKLVLVLALVLAGCANTAAEATPPNPERVTHIVRACKDIMGFSPGETLYVNCVVSLEQTMAAIDEGTRIQSGREACAAKGLEPGSREFAHCVVDRTQVASRATP